MSIHTIFPGGRVDGFFDGDNVSFITNKITELMKREYYQSVAVDKSSIVRVMQRIHLERMESVPKMNQRVIMSIMNEIRNHQNEMRKNLRYEENYKSSQLLYDPQVERGPDLKKIKLKNRLGKPRVGDTVRFVFF